MKFTLKIESDNAAMVDNTRAEVARILEEVARRVYEGVAVGSVRDANGNKVGSFVLDAEGEEDES